MFLPHGTLKVPLRVSTEKAVLRTKAQVELQAAHTERFATAEPGILGELEQEICSDFTAPECLWEVPPSESDSLGLGAGGRVQDSEFQRATQVKIITMNLGRTMGNTDLADSVQFSPSKAFTPPCSPRPVQRSTAPCPFCTESHLYITASAQHPSEQALELLAIGILT